MKVIVPWLLLGAVAILLIGCGSNVNTPQNLWTVTLNSTQFNTQTSFSFFETINGTTLTGSGVTFTTPSPCFGNATNPSGVTISGQVGTTNTPGQSTLTMTMQSPNSSGPSNSLTMTGLFSNSGGLVTGSGNFTLVGNGGSCPATDIGTFTLQSSI